jgi:hypothetical protein
MYSVGYRAVELASVARYVLTEVLTVICQGAHHADDKTSATDCMSSAPSAIVGMLPEDTSILLVDADDVLDHERVSAMSNIGARLKLGHCQIIIQMTVD